MSTNMHGLSQRVAIITGSTGNLGQTVARAFVDAGYRVAGIARRASSSNSGSPSVFELSADLLDVASIGAAVEKALERFRKIDVLVHLAGGFEGGKSIVEMDESALNRMLDINLRTAFNLFRVVVPHMRRQGHGRVIAIGSRTAVEAARLTGAYGASKAALVSLIRTLALENADAGITANIVLPSTIDTAANRAAMPDADPAKWIRPENIADLVLWLASDAASQTTGALIPIYGTEL